MGDGLCKDVKRRFGGDSTVAAAYAKEHKQDLSDLDWAHRNKPRGAVGWHKLAMRNPHVFDNHGNLR